ncbi:transporter substrate-binding domain-containing protein [Methanolacinia paynteri]|uniref:transporter substrate-binding domain-containing protein n=1 Tax=Methanolacinia paynteri TaxID=230356 RepID=UPI000A6BB357|nr:transporter substrate-binding domain-containing protein [Methanolacinia paynteri]
MLNLIISPGYAAYSEDQVLVVGADEYFPPYEYIDYNGRAAGFNIDIMNAVAEEMSLNISVQPGPWHEVRNDLESGKIDFISGMFYSEERDEVVNFSEPYISVSHAIFVREGSDISGPEDLKGKEIVVEEGDIMHDYALGLDSSNTIITTHNQSEALLLLASGKYDAALLSKLHGEHLIMQYGIAGIITAGPPLEIREYCVAASANASNLLPVINEGLVIIRNNGKYDEIYKKWFGVFEEREFFLTLINIVIFILLPVIILLAIALIWSVSLRRKLTKTSSELEDELVKQERVKKALQESKDKYEVLFNSLNEGVFLCEYDPVKKSGRIIEVNDTACRRLGYTREEMMGKNLFDITRMLSYDCETLVEKLTKEKNEISYYAEHVRKDRSVFPVHVKARRLTYGGGEYVLQLARDITKEREFGEREAEALKKIEMNLIQLATLNDEIRNPLTVIAGVTDMETKDSRNIILDQVRRIDEIISRLDRSWIESAKIREFLKKHMEINEKDELSEKK